MRVESFKVSVIIPFFKNKFWLKEALQSVQEQTYGNIEVIVINDGSAEDISDLIQLFSQYYFYETINRGAAAARNFGIEKAVGDFVCFLDSDDLWLKDKIEQQLDFMINNNFSWSHTNYETFLDSNPSVVKIMNPVLEGKIIPKMFIYCPIATPCVMIKRNVLCSNKDIRFNTNFKVGEDSHLWFMLALEVNNLGYLPAVLTRVRLRGSNAAYDAMLQLQSKAQVYNFLKGNSNLFKTKLQYKTTVIGFAMANFLYVFLVKCNMNSGVQKKVSKFFYAVPYLYLKLVSKILRF